ncbi:DsbA family oxidoreductase [Fodinisporobacter ferrooxydans]|uniref:DsbA family oxidoreductase n=1 Tax=Fodinisporobacter ferrooxydans TaxID=2901836 RepID=A0ABY4CK30_9BACL|nr:DsbA family oxidoreductase [Alicyclobacillaceae bacterium MYW30-H2]
MIGKVPLDQLAKERNIEVKWKAFELRPEGVEVPPKPPEYMARAKAGVEALSKQYGIEMKWNDKSPHSRLALEGAKFAEEYGKGNVYHDKVFAAQFQQQKNINDRNVLVDIATEIGLDPEKFREALETRRYRSLVIQEHEEARQMGITGIPCFIVGNRGVMGVQSYESLKRLLDGTIE